MTPVLAVVARGDAADPQTWSGTPAALLRAVASRGVPVVAVDASADHEPLRIASAPLAAALLGARGRSFHAYVGLRKKVSERRLLAQSVPALTHFLHTDYVGISGTRLPPARHALFRDTTLVDAGSAWGVGRRGMQQLRRVEAGVVRSVERIFTCSEWAAERFVHLYGISRDAVEVVGTGLGLQDLEDDRDVLASPDRYASGRTLCVARVRHFHKGIDLLLEAHSLARRQRPDLHLDLVVPRGTVQAQAGVSLHHDLPRERLLQLFGEVALYAMPARWEPWGLVYIEAMRHSTPILVSALCAGPELAGQGKRGFIVEENSPRAVAEALLKAHADPVQLQALGAAGAESTRRSYLWARTAASIAHWVNSSSDLLIDTD